jgi:hypothetical protein
MRSDALVLASRYIITSRMTDASTHGQRHRHAADDLRRPAQSQGADLRFAAQQPAGRASLIESAAGARLFGVSFLIAALWAGVFWALH